MTTDKETPYWEQDIAECLRVAAEIIGPNSYYLGAAEYIEEMRERLLKLEGSVNTLESECNQLNDKVCKQIEQIDNLASMCRRLSYSVKRSGNDKLAHECVVLLKKYDLGGAVLRNMEGPADLCPKPAPGLEVDARGVLVKKDSHD